MGHVPIACLMVPRYAGSGLQLTALPVASYTTLGLEGAVSASR
jgi:hypothetical protein